MFSLHQFPCTECPLKHSGVLTISPLLGQVKPFYCLLSLFLNFLPLSVLLFLTCFIYFLFFSPSLSLSLLLSQSLSSCRCQRGMTTICSPPAPWHLEMGWDTTRRARAHNHTLTHTVFTVVKAVQQKREETGNEVQGGVEGKERGHRDLGEVLWQ